MMPTWQKSTELSEFVNWSLDSYIKDAVTVFLCYDDKNLYVAFRNCRSCGTPILKKRLVPKAPGTHFYGEEIMFR